MVFRAYLSKTKPINLVLSALVFCTFASMLQRAFVRRSWLVPLPVADQAFSPPSGMQLEVSKLYPEAYREDTYQLAYLIESLRPASTLKDRRLIDSPQGEVAVGVDSEGRLELQTCLMDSGRVAVTHQRMASEVSSAISGNPRRRTELLLQGVLLGRPMTSRPCLLIQLRSDQPPPAVEGSRQQLEGRLLQVFGPTLQALQPIGLRQLR